MVKARRATETVCSNAGLMGSRLDDFIIAAGEAITNALKHATSAQTYAGTRDGTVWIGVVDNGPGIDSLILPKAVLRRGFSTKPSLGLGYSIMLGVADQVLLDTGPTGTKVVLVRNIGDAPPMPLSSIVDTWEGIETRTLEHHRSEPRKLIADLTLPFAPWYTHEVILKLGGSQVGA